MTALARWILTWVAVMVLFGVIDAGWITWVVLPSYRAELGDVMASTIDPVAVGLFYLLYCAGLTYFGVAPQCSDRPFWGRVANGALYGLFTYATWALTFKVVMEAASWSLVANDILWGAFICAVTTAIGTWTYARYIAGLHRKEPT